MTINSINTEILAQINSIDTSALKIYGIGFDETNKACFNKNLLEQLLVDLPGMEIINTIPNDADVLIINLNKKFTYSIFQSNTPPENCFVILIAHEITRTTLSILKFADHIIYTNDLQQYVCEESLELEYNSSVLPYAFGETIASKSKNSNCIVYFEGDDFLLNESHYESRLKQTLEWYPTEEIETYYVLVEVAPSEGQRFEQFKINAEGWEPRFKIYNSREFTPEQIYDLIGNSMCGQLFKNEITLEQYITNLENKEPWILNETLSESPILSAFRSANIQVVPSLEKTFYNFNLKNTSTWNDWRNEIRKILNESYAKSTANKKQTKAGIVIDTIEDLNIVLGKPLTNDYILSVCFRNQEAKIIRCIQSLINQAGDYDFGISIISDCSTDKSIDLILDFLKDIKIDVCVVSNTDRKYAARNLYNVAHSIVTNDESVIIEVDGDDFLAGNHVISTMDTYYKNGALKTNGSFKFYPEDQSGAPVAQTDYSTNFDTSRPWSYEYCASWVPLRTVKRHLICQLEVDYFLEKKTKQWLREGDDSATQPRMIELAKDKFVFVKDILYCYDRSGMDHEVMMDNSGEEIFKSYKKMDKFHHLLDYRLDNK